MICRKAVEALIKQDMVREEREYFSKGICPSCGHTSNLIDMIKVGKKPGDFTYKCPKCRYEIN